MPNRATVLPAIAATLLGLTALFFNSIPLAIQELLPWFGLAGGILGAILTPRSFPDPPSSG